MEQIISSSSPLMSAEDTPRAPIEQGSTSAHPEQRTGEHCFPTNHTKWSATHTGQMITMTNNEQPATIRKDFSFGKQSKDDHSWPEGHSEFDGQDCSSSNENDEHEPATCNTGLGMDDFRQYE